MKFSTKGIRLYTSMYIISKHIIVSYCCLSKFWGFDFICFERQKFVA